MKNKFIPAETSFAQWKKDPKYMAQYAVLEEEFALASALIKARGNADMTLEQVAEAMGTTQAVVARLESGKAYPLLALWSASLKPRTLAFASVSSRPMSQRIRLPSSSY